MSKTIPKKHLNITEAGKSTRNYKNKPQCERNPNASKIKHGIYSKNQIKFDTVNNVFNKKKIRSWPYSTYSGRRCPGGDGRDDTFTKVRRRENKQLARVECVTCDTGNDGDDESESESYFY